MLSMERKRLGIKENWEDIKKLFLNGKVKKRRI